MAWTQIIDKDPEVKEEVKESLESKEDCLMVLKEICCELKAIHSLLKSDKEEIEEEIILNERK